MIDVPDIFEPSIESSENLPMITNAAISDNVKKYCRGIQQHQQQTTTKLQRIQSHLHFYVQENSLFVTTGRTVKHRQLFSDLCIIVHILPTLC